MAIDLFPVGGLRSSREDIDGLGTVVSIKAVMGDQDPKLSSVSHPIRMERHYTRWYRLLKRGHERDEEMAEYHLTELVEMTLFEFWELED